MEAAVGDGATYDQFGREYRRVRVPDARIAALIEAALGDVTTVVNVGAGAGSYESATRAVVAVEPSAVMIRQRPAGSAPVVQARAESLPLGDRAFDAATAFLTIHHWSDVAAGLRELRRVVKRRVVILTYDPMVVAGVQDDWLTSDYFPDVGAAARTVFPSRSVLESTLGPCASTPVPVPADCTDGFLHAYWARPEAYLDASVRGGIFWFQKLPAHVLDDALRRLERDLRTGEWDARYGHLRSQESFDAGLRILMNARSDS